MNRILWTAMIAAVMLLSACDDEDKGGGGAAGPYPPLHITTPSLPIGTDGQPYSATLSATGGTDSGYTWSVIAGTLPSQLTLEPSGTPDTTLWGPSGGNFPSPGVQFTIQVEDSAGNKAHVPYTYTSSGPLPPPPPQAPTITTVSLPDTVFGSVYQESVQAAGTAPLTWSVSGGALPPGLTLQSATSATAEIAGQSSALGTYDFSLRVSNALGFDERWFTIVVYNLSWPPTQATHLFVCEASAQTSGTVNTAMRAELTSVLQGLAAQDEFDIIVYGGAFPGGYTYFSGSLLPATQGNVSAAVTWVNGPALNPGGALGTTMYDAWEDSFNYQGVDNAYYLYHNVTGSAANILSDLAGWAAQHPNRGFTAVAFSPNSSAATFGQQAAALVGGTYIAY